MDKMSRSLSEYMITGVKTTIAFEQAILQDPNFRRGVYSTNFLEELLGGARRELIEFPDNRLTGISTATGITR
jgi:acetyl-CoA carboxylase, biotin carboxylase subunit